MGGAEEIITFPSISYYVEVDSNFSPLENNKVSFFNSDVTDKTETTNIGNNRFITAKRYLIENNKFYVSVPSINTESVDGEFLCKINNVCYKIKCFSTKNDLTVNSVSVGGTTAEKKATVFQTYSLGTYTVAHTKTHNNIYLNFKFGKGKSGKTALADGTKIFTKKISKGKTIFGTEIISESQTTLYPTGYFAEDSEFNEKSSVAYTVCASNVGKVEILITMQAYTD